MTPGALCNRSMVASAAHVLAGLIGDQAHLAALEPGEFSSAGTSMPGLKPLLPGFAFKMADAASVATWPRKLGDVALAVGMHAIAQDNDRRLTFGIDPNAGAGEAGVAEALAGREQLAAIAGIARLHVPPISAQNPSWRRPAAPRVASSST